MPQVRVPAPLRPLTGGRGLVVVEGATVRQVLAGLDAAHPGVGARLLDADGALYRHVNVFVGSVDVRDRAGLATLVGPADVVSLVPAVAGGG